MRISSCCVLSVGEKEIQLTRREAQIMELLLPGRTVSYETLENALWPIASDAGIDPRDTIKTHISNMRAKIPFRINNIKDIGYVSDLTDHTLTRAKVEHVLTRIKGALTDTEILGDLNLDVGPREYSEATGKGSFKSSNDDVQIDVIITPNTGDTTLEEGQ